MEIISEKKFLVAALDLGKKAFVIHLAHLRDKMTIYLAQKAQIALLVAKKVTVSAKYSDFVDSFSKESAAKLHKYFDTKKYLINLKSDKQPPCGPIYSLRLVELDSQDLH